MGSSPVSGRSVGRVRAHRRIRNGPHRALRLPSTLVFLTSVVGLIPTPRLLLQQGFHILTPIRAQAQVVHLQVLDLVDQAQARMVDHRSVDQRFGHPR